MFKRFVEFLSDHAVSPNRVGQEEQDDGSVVYRDDAPVTFSSEGESFTLGPEGVILDAAGARVGTLELWEDWYWQAMDMFHDAIQAGRA